MFRTQPKMRVSRKRSLIAERPARVWEASRFHRELIFMQGIDWDP